MSNIKFLDLHGLSTLILKLKSIFATSTQGEKADQAFAHSREDHAPSNAEKNVIIGIQRNGVNVPPNSSRIVNINVPQQISELENDSEYLTINNTGNSYTPGVTKIYQSTGNAADGCMSQRATSEALSTKADNVHSHIIVDINEPQHQNNGDVWFKEVD